MKNTEMDKKVLALLSTIELKKKALKKAEKRPQWKTNCNFESAEGKHTNIQTVRTTDKLVEMCAMLILLQDSFFKAANVLEVEHDYQHGGYTVNDWVDDMKTRVSMLTLEKDKKEIKELDERVNKLVTADQRREMELKQLQDLLGG